MYGLKLYELNDISDSVIVHLAECVNLCSKLKSLDFVFGEGVHKDLKLFTSSKNIERLNVSLPKDQAIIESFLDYVSCNLLELKHLDISGYSNDVLDCKFDLICKLPKLEVLHISGQSKITGSGLENFTNLRRLICYICENLEDENLICFLKCARNLKFLNLKDCNKITNKVIETAIEETRKRTNNIVLEIQVEGTNIKPDETKEKSELLRLTKDRETMDYIEI